MPSAVFDPAGLAAALAASAPPAPAPLELALHASVAMGDGALGNNGWLHELPDPITKVTWGNVAALAPATAARLGLADGDVVEIRAGQRRVRLPVLAQPGTHPRAVAVAVGYGRTAAGPVGNGVGANAFVLAGARAVELKKTGERRRLAVTQTHSSLEGRPHVQEVALSALGAAKAATPAEKHASMWPGHEYRGHRWGMVVDLNACTGCSACLVSCQAENNVPVVGADEVRRRREMSWIRVDRYYSGPPEDPRVVHQPMLCQHCENAPCETVCPVLATVHSAEGLNQQVYNRCVGTRYCANNCPPKVRRFNWFEYPHGDPVERMVLNPDVVVRTRGVMEKCSFCVQRIEEAKAGARREGRQLADGEVRAACQQSCPAQAIAFGDLNDPQSEVARLARGGRAYKVLEELNVGPVVSYLARVKNDGSDRG